MIKLRSLILHWAISCACLLGNPPLTQLYSLEEFSKLSDTLAEVSTKAKAATVCIDLGDGATGSGVIVSPDGLILSAAHVTQKVGKKLEIILEDGSRYSATALGMNTSSDASMAKIEPSIHHEEFPYVPLSKRTEIGQYVFSLGHSGGFDLERGIVLRLGRIIDLESTSLHSDCPLIGGDSGGPLFDLEGNVIAIHSRVGTVTNSNTHVPISDFKKHWKELEEGELWGDGSFANAGLLFQGMRLIEQNKRLEVMSITPDSNAAQAGFQKGDLVIKINDIELSSLTALLTILMDAKNDNNTLTEIPVDIQRDDETKTLTLQVNE